MTGIRELSFEEVGAVSGADFWGKVEGAGIILGGLTTIAIGVAAAGTGAGAAAAPFVVIGGAVIVAAGVEKIIES